MKSKEITLISLFAAIYAVTGLIPISNFIGAPSWLGLNLIITPIIALMFTPLSALVTGLLGGVVGFIVAPASAPFGPLSILLPASGAFFGSLVHNSAYRDKGRTGHNDNQWIAGIFLFLAIATYTVNTEYVPFIAPHFVAMVLALLSPIHNDPLKNNHILARLRIPFSAFIATMCEQAMMMIFAVSVLQLPSEVFIGIFPLMLYERTVATIGGTMLILGIKRVLK